MCFHPSVSLNNEKICCAISEDKIAVCEKTAGLRSGNFSDLNSACQKVVVPVKIFQFEDMLNENHFSRHFSRSQQTDYYGSVGPHIGGIIGNAYSYMLGQKEYFRPDIYKF